jgi:hypothetical protein
MVGKLQPLVNNQMIVGPDGKPTEYFIRWAQQRQIDIGQAIDEDRALEIIQAFIDDYALQAGSGISITPDGKLTSNPTISAEAQAILNQISTTHGAVLFRGAANWQALAPGTAGQFLKTNGAGADPSWAAGGGGGGGLTPPVSGDFPNTHGSPTITYAPNSLLLSDLSNGSGLSGVGRSTTGSFTFTGKVSTLVRGSFNSGGIFATDGTRYLVIGQFFSSGIRISQWTSRTSFSSEPVTITPDNIIPTWFRMVYNGTNVNLQLSYTGDNWINAQTGNTWLTGAVTEVGFVMNRNNTSFSPAMWVESWELV